MDNTPAKKDDPARGGARPFSDEGSEKING
jgi:hypothetical protein